MLSRDPHAVIYAALQAVQRLSQQQLSSWQPAAAWQQRALVQLPRALKDEEAELDRITKEAGQSDMWGNELVGNAVKVNGERIFDAQAWHLHNC